MQDQLRLQAGPWEPSCWHGLVWLLCAAQHQRPSGQAICLLAPQKYCIFDGRHMCCSRSTSTEQAGDAGWQRFSVFLSSSGQLSTLFIGCKFNQDRSSLLNKWAVPWQYWYILIVFTRMQLASAIAIAIASNHSSCPSYSCSQGMLGNEFSLGQSAHQHVTFAQCMGHLAARNGPWSSPWSNIPRRTVCPNHEHMKHVGSYVRLCLELL